LATSAAAAPPLHEGPFAFPVHVDDFFLGAGSPTCDFRVVGDWNVVVEQTTFYDESGNTVRIFTRIDFSGTLSNADTGASIPDAGIILLWDYFAPDGSFIQEVEHHTRFNPLLRAAFRSITNDEGNIIFDVGRDWLPFNRHPISITPVCNALAP
jgi:hypothetical protein